MLDLANTFGARWLISAKSDHGSWPAILDGPDPAAACFEEVLLPVPDDPDDARAIEEIRVFRIGCQGVAGRSSSRASVTRVACHRPLPSYAKDDCSSPPGPSHAAGSLAIATRVVTASHETAPLTAQRCDDWPSGRTMSRPLASWQRLRGIAGRDRPGARMARDGAR